MKMKMIKIKKNKVFLQMVCQIQQLFQTKENQIIWVLITTLVIRITLKAYIYKQSDIILKMNWIEKKEKLILQFNINNW